MFAGKTTALLAVVHQMEKLGKSVEVYKPITDTRHAEAEVISHEGIRCHANWLSPDAFPLPTSADIIAIDEAQFLSAEAVPAVLNVILSGVSVVLAGLDLTWKGVPFGHLPTFMAHADEVRKLRSRCAVCGNSACRSYRLIQSEATVLVGGAEAYEPRCLRCFQPGG
jgi:thymidine kinase